MKKRILASLLCLCLLAGLLPGSVLATESGPGNAGQTVFAAGEASPIALDGSGTQDVTISGYSNPEDWYVMDGLVLMYDGIYNAGMGQADPDAAGWQELTGTVSPAGAISTTWDQGATVSDTALTLGNLDGDLQTEYTNGFTLESAYTLKERMPQWIKNTTVWADPQDHAAGTKTIDSNPEYVSPINNIFGSSIMAFRPNNSPVLFYYKNDNWVASAGAAWGYVPADEFLQYAMSTNAEDVRKLYVAGVQQGKPEDKNTDVFEITAGQLSLPVWKQYVDGTDYTQTAGRQSNSYAHVIHLIRLYNRQLTDAEMAQNAAIDKARYADHSYKAPGTVQSGAGAETALLEYDFSAGGGQGGYSTTLTGVDVSEPLYLRLNREGSYTLTITAGEDTVTKEITVLSQEEYTLLSAAESKIAGLPDAAAMGNLEQVVAAQKAYTELPAALQALVSDALKAKLDAAIETIDREAAGKHQVSLTLDAGGGSLPDSEKVQTVTYKGGSFTLPVPVLANHTFQGWYLSDTRVTDGAGASLKEWDSLSGAQLTAKWAHNASVGAALDISEAEDVYALARILAKQPADDADAILTAELRADYLRFGISSGYHEAYADLQTAEYILKQDISLTNSRDGNEAFQGIPNFAGTFDGQGRTITVDFTLAGTQSGSAQFGCLFKTLGTARTGSDEAKGATVKNLYLSGRLVTGAGGLTVAGGLQDIGVLAGASAAADHTLENIVTDVETDLTILSGDTSTCAYVGALVGRMNSGTGSVVKNCVNRGSLTVNYQNMTANGGGRLGGLAGHVYSGVHFVGCTNSGSVSTAGSDENRTNAGGLAGSGGGLYTDCVQAGGVTSNGFRVYAFSSMSEDSTGNQLRLTVTGKAGDTIAYGSESVTLTADNTSVSFDTPVAYAGGTVENNGFSYGEFLTVNGTRLDWYNLTSTVLTAALDASEAKELSVPFQSASDAIVISTADQLLALQKALNEGDESAIDALYRLGGRPAPDDDAEARTILQTAYYKLGGNLTADNPAYTGIGTPSYPFSGHFDGQGNTITLSLTGANAYMGLFGYVNTGAGGVPEIRNLSLDVSIDAVLTAGTGSACIGGLAGRMDAAEISGVTVELRQLTLDGETTGTVQAGGLLGNGVLDGDSTVALTVSGPIQITADCKNMDAGGAVGSGRVAAPITVTYTGSAAMTVKNGSANAGSVNAGGLLGYSGGGSIDLSGCRLVNDTGDVFTISTEASGSNRTGGWAGYLTSATATPDDRVALDRTTSLDGRFSIDAKSTGANQNTSYTGGIAGWIGQAYSLDAAGYVNTIDLRTDSGYAGGFIGFANTGGAKELNLDHCLNTGSVAGSQAAGGLIGYASGYTVTLSDSAAGGTVTSVAQNRGGLVGRLNGTLVSENSLYLKTDAVTGAVGGGQAGGETGTVALDTTKLSGRTFGSAVEILSGAAPGALAVAGGAALSGRNLTFTRAGDSVCITFLWNGARLYQTAAAVSPLDVSDLAVITGINNVYPTDEAAAEAAVQVVCGGSVLTAGTDYLLEQNSSTHTFSITFTGNYCGSAEKPYTVSGNALDVFSAGYLGVYDGRQHGIAVTAPEGAEVTYSLLESGPYTETEILGKDAGTKVVYWKAALNGKEASGSAAVSIAPAEVTIAVLDQSVPVGTPAPSLAAPIAGTHYTVSGLCGTDTLIVAPVLTYPETPDTSAAGSFVIRAGGADAGSNYTIHYTDGTLTVSAAGAGAAAYAVSVDQDMHNGTVTASHRSALRGQVVTLTAAPDAGYELHELTVTDRNGAELSLTDAGGGRFTFVMPASRVAVSASFLPSDSGNPAFTDVSEGDFFHDAVHWAVSRGIASGVSASAFRPDAVCTRAQMVTFLWRAAGSPKSSGNHPFSDVPDGAYYSDAVLWAVENGIARGTGPETFSPNDAVTRCQAVAFLYRAAGAPAVSGSSFSDVPAGAWYADAVAWAAASGVTNGTGNHRFSPSDACTRGQIVTFLYRDMAD